MDRAGADFFNVVDEIKDKLGANPIPLQVPIGSEDSFRGVVDLIQNKAIIWNEEDMGMTFEEIEIPADILDEATQLREELLEAVAEFDESESLMEKFFDDPASITEREILDCLREATIAGKVDGQLVDAAYLIDSDCELQIITEKDSEGLEIIRHSTAHLMAQAVQSLFPNAQVTIGPVIDDGFYYDFAYEESFSPDDLIKIEQKQQKLIFIQKC